MIDLIKSAAWFGAACTSAAAYNHSHLVVNFVLTIFHH